MPRPERSRGRPIRCRPMRRSLATRRCRSRPARRGATRARADYRRRHVDQLHARCGARTAVRARRQSRSGLRQRRAPRRQPLYELDPRSRCEDRHLSQPLLARAGRLPRLGSRRRSGPRHHQGRQARRRRGAQRRPAPRLRPGDRPEALRDGDHDARERGRAAVDDAHALLPGRGRRDRMERAGLQPRHEPVLQRHRRLVRDGDARSGRARQEAGSDMDRAPSWPPNSANAISIGPDG